MKGSHCCCPVSSLGDAGEMASSCQMFGADADDCGRWVWLLLLAELTEGCLLFLTQDLTELTRVGVLLTTDRTWPGPFAGDSKCGGASKTWSGSIEARGSR